MTYEVLNTCVLVPGVSETNCAAWVQAWGSLIGLAIAIGVPVFLRYFEQKNKRAIDHATAHVVCAGISLMVGSILETIDVLQGDCDELRDANGIIDFTRMWNAAEIPVPSEWQLLQLCPLEPRIATELAVGTNLFVKARTVIGLFARGVKNEDDAVDDFVEINATLSHAYFHLASAKEEMDDFFGHSHRHSKESQRE